MQFDVRRFDIYRKVPKDLTQPTLTGAVISILCCFFIVTLLLVEFTYYLKGEVASELFVNYDARHDEKIPVRINISVPALTCDLLGLDIQDEMGRHEVGAVENTEKVPINNNQGCMFAGTFSINKVPGNFHMSTHASGRHDVQPNFQHILHELSFGDKLSAAQYSALPGGSFNPMFQLDQSKAEEIASHEYVLKIVPTIYEQQSGAKSYLYQYTYAHKTYLGLSHGHSIIPAVWFRYDLNPITVKYSERRAPLYTFLTAVCAVVGGAFTVAGILDSIVFSAHEIIRKIEIGKIS